MQKTNDYADLTTHRRRSVLPPELQSTIVALTRELNAGSNVEAHLSDYVRGIETLPASSIARAAAEISDVGKLYRCENIYQSAEIVTWISSHRALQSELEALEKHPRLSHLFMFHRDGRLREAALSQVDKAPASPFTFAAIVYRLNDWVEEVRAAACACSQRLFPRTSATVISEAALYLFARLPLLQRWGPREHRVLHDTLYRADVMQAFAERLIALQSGKSAQALLQALSRPGLDPFLPRMALEAAQPLVRAISLETLLNRSARWPVGYGVEWVDKSYGIRKRVRLYENRAIEHQLELEELLRKGAGDRAAVVRRVAASAMIRLRHDLSPGMSDLARRLLHDRSSSVRSRAAFYLDNLP